VEQGLQELSNKRVDSFPAGEETTASTSVARPPESPLGNSFFLILPNLISSNTPIPFP